MTRRRNWVFAASAIALLVSGAAVALLHLDPDGNAVIAKALAPHVRAMMEKS